MTRAEIRTFILSKTREEIATWGGRDGSFSLGMTKTNRANAITAMRLARDSAASYDPSAWLGRPLSSAERQAWSRELASMERDGLIARLGPNCRTLAIRLVKA